MNEQLALLPDIVVIHAHNQTGKHLKKCETRPYHLRVTIDQGPKFVGKRISMSLGTRDHGEALKLSEHLITILKKSNFILSAIKTEK